MNKSKKNAITFLVVVLLIGGLLGVYFWQGNRLRAEEAAATPSPSPEPTTFLLIDREEKDLDQVVFKNAGRSMTLASRTEEDEVLWYLKNDPEIEIDQTAARDMVRGMYYLSVAEKLFNQVDNPAEFGIGTADTVAATATYTDGSQRTLHIGKLTPAKDRYYLMLEGDPALYLLYTYYGTRYYNDESALIDRTLPTFDSNSVEYIYIAERGKDPIEFGFDGTDEEKQEMYDQYGMVYVTMMQPYPGRELYYSNFEKNVMNDYQSFSIGEMQAFKPADLSIYGLDDPSLELRMLTQDSEMHLLFGDRTEDGKIYVKFYDRPHVFTADYEPIKSMFNINVFSFVEKFVALVNIQDCVSIDIKSQSGDRNYRMDLNHYVIPPESDEDEPEENIRPTVNGQEIQEKAFRTYYQQLIGLSYDTEIEPYEPTTEPEFTVTYDLGEKEPVIVRFYHFDSNFYAVQRDDNPVQFVTSKQSTEIMFQSMQDLLAGKLDR